MSKIILTDIIIVTSVVVIIQTRYGYLDIND